jgi:chromosome segregation ATPase
MEDTAGFAHQSWSAEGDSTMSTMLPSSADGNMVAVAARIQDRAMQLHAEQTKLNTVLAELDKTRHEAQKETDVNSSRRRNMLEAINSRNGIELELYQARDKIDGYRTTIQKLQQETEIIEEAIAKAQAQWKDDVQNLYSPHQLEMELYQQTLEAALDAREQRSRQRAEQLEKLETKARNLKEREECLRLECTILREGTQSLEKREDAEDKEVSSLASQVREALAKVSDNLLAASSNVIPITEIQFGLVVSNLL